MKYQFDNDWQDNLSLHRLSQNRGIKLGTKKKKEKVLGLRDFLMLFIGCGIIMTTVKAATVLIITRIMFHYQYIRLFGRLWDMIELAETVVANGYLGILLSDDLGTGVSVRERRLMEELASRMDVVVQV